MLFLLNAEYYRDAINGAIFSITGFKFCFEIYLTCK